MTSRWTMSAVAALLAACSSSTTRTRPVTLVSVNSQVDRTLAAAQRDALDGSDEALARARQSLTSLLQTQPTDPLAPLTQTLLVRVLVASDRVDEARRVLVMPVESSDPTVAIQREYLRGLLDVRGALRTSNTGDHRALMRAAQSRLMGMLGSRPDPAETVELACAVAECAPSIEAPSEAIRTLTRALASVERAENHGVPWIRTGLRCEDSALRQRLVLATGNRVTDLHALTDAIDQSVAGSSLRRILAERLLLLARERNEVARYLAWFADLPDDRAAERAQSEARSTVAILGILAPLSGPRAVLGTSIIRGAQRVVAQYREVRLAIEDEGETPDQSAPALERLYQRGARAVVGPTREDFAAAAAIRAQSLGVSLYLLAAPPGVEQTGAAVRLATPTTLARAEALAQTLLQLPHGPRAQVAASRENDLLAEGIDDALLQRGVAVRRVTLDGMTLPSDFRNEIAVIAGDLGREMRSAVAHRSVQMRNLVVDARAAMAATQDAPSDTRTQGTWVGTQAGPGLAAMVQAYCAQNGEAPSELALLAHDATLRAMQDLHRVQLRPIEPALSPTLALTVGTVRLGAVAATALPAAAWPCPSQSARSASP
ncbi:MAG: ABC transporter substrate-binding protein [Deltaproteobacteria bacterium]|nr:ABC transporter substrate-binding protein [Deltaproteobacteria bacterium]